MRVLVTGASGFVGSALVEKLIEQKNDVWALVHDSESPRSDDLHRENVIRGSLIDLQACERAVVKSDPHIVFHLGAQAIVPYARRDPHATMEANVRGTYNIAEAFRRHRANAAVMVVASSDKAYGEARRFPDGEGFRPYHEDDALEGRGPYDASKSCADLIAQSYAHEYGLPIGIVRAGNIYGPGDRDMTRIVPCIASALTREEAPVLMSDGNPVRDYLYIDDAVDGYLRVAHHVYHTQSTVPSDRAFNISGGEPISVRRLAETAAEIAGHPSLAPVVLGTRVGEIAYQVLDSRLARRVLGWVPRTDLYTGLRNTIEWWMGQI